MCSIGGFYASSPLLPETARRLASALLFFGRDRGSQSSGVFYNGQLVKAAADPHNFIYTEQFQNLFNTRGAGPSVCLTHTRMPTSGGRGDAQAHPFWIGNTVVVHNGMISNAASMAKKWELEKTSGVDSEVITAALAKVGVGEKLEEIIQSFSGNAAIAAWHEGELYLARDGNPLEYVHVELGSNPEQRTQLLIFGSTQSQVIGALNHCWLVANMRVSKSLDTLALMKASPKGVFTRACRFDMRGGYGGGSHSPFRGGRHATPVGSMTPGGVERVWHGGRLHTGADSTIPPVPAPHQRPHTFRNGTQSTLLGAGWVQESCSPPYPDHTLWTFDSVLAADQCASTATQKGGDNRGKKKDRNRNIPQGCRPVD